MKKIVFQLALISSVFTAVAQENLSYQTPPKEIVALADYQRAPSVSMDSKKQYMVLSYRNTYKSLEDLNQEEMKLGGLRINPVTNISSTVTYVNNISVRKISDKEEIKVKGLPENPRIANMVWSPNETKMAFTHTSSLGLELWILDVASATASKVSNRLLNGNLGNPISWFNDSETLLVKVLPANRPTLINAAKDIPKGPIVSSGDGICFSK
jgi:hypothetical protein